MLGISLRLATPRQPQPDEGFMELMTEDGDPLLTEDGDPLVADGA